MNMKKRINYLVNVIPALDGVAHISTSKTFRGYSAKGVNGRKVITNILREYDK